MVRAPYWAAQRLLGAAAHPEVWPAFDGDCALRGIDPLDLPPSRFANAFEVWLQERWSHAQDGQQQWARFRAQVYAPPTEPGGRSPASDITGSTGRRAEVMSEAAEGAAFMAFMRATS